MFQTQNNFLKKLWTILTLHFGKIENMNYSDKEQAVSILKNYQQNRFREDRMLTHFFSFCKNLHLKSINYHICLISLGNSHPLIGKSDLAIQPLTLEKQISPNRKILLLWEIVREAKWSWVHSPQGQKNFEVQFFNVFRSHCAK